MREVDLRFMTLCATFDPFGKIIISISNSTDEYNYAL